MPRNDHGQGKPLALCKILEIMYLETRFLYIYETNKIHFKPKPFLISNDDFKLIYKEMDILHEFLHGG